MDKAEMSRLEHPDMKLRNATENTLCVSREYFFIISFSVTVNDSFSSAHFHIQINTKLLEFVILR
jgi:hypothetical protein